MKVLKIIEYIIKVLVMLIFTLSILVFHAFGLRFVTEFADELGYTDLQITIFEISFLGIYFLIGWLLIITLGYMFFRKDIQWTY